MLSKWSCQFKSEIKTDLKKNEELTKHKQPLWASNRVEKFKTCLIFFVPLPIFGEFGISWCIHIGNRYTPTTKFPWFFNLIPQINHLCSTGKRVCLILMDVVWLWHGNAVMLWSSYSFFSSNQQVIQKESSKYTESNFS